jgi:hypothetical protein
MCRHSSDMSAGYQSLERPATLRSGPWCLAWFASPTVTFLPSGVVPVMEVPAGIDRPPPGVSGVIHSRVASQSVIPS